LASKYHGYLDEQTNNFNKLKVFLGEKDALILDLHAQIQAREELNFTQVAQMRQELTYSQNCIKNELMTTIGL
jgi:hypothetical protein